MGLVLLLVFIINAMRLIDGALGLLPQAGYFFREALGERAFGFIINRQ